MLYGSQSLGAFGRRTIGRGRSTERHQDEADSDESASSPKKKKPALPLPPPAPPVPIRPSFEQLYYSGTVVAPSTAAISSGRFSKGSVAERIACAIQEGSVSASPWYGTEMVRFAIRSVAPKNRECARLLIGAMLYDAAPKQHFEAKHNSALREAGRDVDAYYETCSSEERIPSRAIVYSLYWSRVEPLYDSTISRVMGCETNYTAAHYFAQAILFVWKICESSPFCCEANLAYGGAAAKKKRSHTTIARIGAAALFELADGLAHRISYDKNTRRVFMPSPSGGVDDPRAKGRQVETVHVEFLPAHRYLKLRLPRAAEVSRFLKLGNIEGTYGGGGAKADKSVIESRGWICRCYRSLLQRGTASHHRPDHGIPFIRVHQALGRARRSARSFRRKVVLTTASLLVLPLGQLLPAVAQDLVERSPRKHEDLVVGRAFEEIVHGHDDVVRHHVPLVVDLLGEHLLSLLFSFRRSAL